MESNQHPFLAGLPAEHTAILLRNAREVEFAPNDLLFREGDPANRFYLLLSGRIVLESRAGARGSVLIQQLGEGDVLGWSWLFPPFVWHFQAKAIESSKALVCDGGDLLVTCEENRELGYEVMKRIAQVLIRRLQASRKQLVQIQAILNPPQSGRRSGTATRTLPPKSD